MMTHITQRPKTEKHAPQWTTTPKTQYSNESNAFVGHQDSRRKPTMDVDSSTNHQNKLSQLTALTRDVPALICMREKMTQPTQ